MFIRFPDTRAFRKDCQIIGIESSSNDSIDWKCNYKSLKFICLIIYSVDLIQFMPYVAYQFESISKHFVNGFHGPIFSPSRNNVTEQGKICGNLYKCY